MSDFAPSVGAAAAAGIKTSRSPYPSNPADGARVSLEEIARRIREGQSDPRIVELAGKILVEAGFSGRGNAAGSTRDRVGALLNWVRGWLLYAPDAPGSERMASAAALACVSKDLCIRIGDCFPQGTLLLRDDYELVPIEQIKIGERIWGLDKWTTVKDAWFTGSKKIDTLVLNNGSQVPLSREHHVFVARCTPPHVKSVYGDGRCTCPMSNRHLERVQLSDVQPGDVLPQPERIPFGDVEADPEMSYLEGLYVSDGWCSDPRRINISGLDGCRKEEQKREVQAICEKRGIYTRWHRKYIAVNSKDLAAKMAPLGTRARFKHVKTIALREEALRELLRGVMADSTANHSTTARTFSTTSDALMVQTRVMMRMTGRSSGIHFLTPKMHRGFGQHGLWRLTPREPKQIADKLLRIKSVERGTGKLPCWDITTEDGFVYLPAHDVTVSNCDDNLILLGSLAGAAGIPTRVVKQHFGQNVQEHVLLEAQDESGAWFYADPSTDMPLGEAPRALSEVRVDPLDQAVGDVGTGAELITMGKPPNTGVGDACCGSCASGTECQGKMKPELLGVGAGTHGGGHFHGGGGFQRGIHHRFHQGRWWAWWPDQGGWLVVDGESCNRWGDVITNPPADVYAEAARQLAASNGAPVSEHFGDALYLFTLENGAVVIRSCASTVGYGQTLTERHAHGVGAVGVGFCDYDLIKSVRARLVAPWYALNGDVDACPAFPVAQRYAFKGDFDSFVNWYSGALPNDIFCKDAERDEIEQGRDFESRLNNWRKILSSTNCQLSAPDLPPLTQDDPRSRDYKPSEGTDIASSIKSVLVTAGIVGAVGVGVYVTMPLLRAAVESLTEKTKAATRKRALAK